MPVYLVYHKNFKNINFGIVNWKNRTQTHLSISQYNGDYVNVKNTIICQNRNICIVKISNFYFGKG